MSELKLENIENISVRYYKLYSFPLCCIASWFISHIYHSHYITFSWCQISKKGLYTIYCQLLSKFSVRKSKSKKVGTVIIWELHHRIKQNGAIFFKNKKDKMKKKAQKEEMEE